VLRKNLEDDLRRLKQGARRLENCEDDENAGAEKIDTFGVVSGK